MSVLATLEWFCCTLAGCTWPNWEFCLMPYWKGGGARPLAGSLGGATLPSIIVVKRAYRAVAKQDKQPSCNKQPCHHNEPALCLPLLLNHVNPKWNSNGQRWANNSSNYLADYSAQRTLPFVFNPEQTMFNPVSILCRFILQFPACSCAVLHQSAR